jgi:hypothetical protein
MLPTAKMVDLSATVQKVARANHAMVCGLVSPVKLVQHRKSLAKMEAPSSRKLVNALAALLLGLAQRATHVLIHKPIAKTVEN